MVDLQAAHRYLVGNACLYRDLARKPRPFLRRNLNQVLDAHARSLTLQTRRPDDLPVPYMEPTPQEQFTTGWDYDLKPPMLRNLARGLTPVLRIDALQFRLLARDDSHWRTREPESSPAEPEFDFLPASSGENSWKCVVHVDILDGERDANTRQAVVTRQLVRGTLWEWNDHDGVPFFEVVLQDSFHFAVDEYFLGTQLESNGGRYWNGVVDRDYTMEVTVEFPSLRDAQEVFSHMEGHDVGVITQNKDGVMKAVWSQLPTCPPAGHLLPTKRYLNRSELTELRFGMDVSMGWSRKADSPLQQFNQLRQPATQQLPTPSSSSASEPSSVRHSIRYVFQEGLQTRVCIISDLRCIFCRDEYFGSSLQHLRQHYVVNHEYFKFELQKTTTGDPEHEAATFLMTRAEQDSCSPDIDEARSTAGYTRVAPDEPYDIEKHLDGDDSWARRGVGGWGYPDALRKRATDDSSKRRKTARLPRALPREPRALGEQVEPEDVAGPSNTRERQHSPPILPDGVEAYSETTRQPLQPGDDLCESDREPEDMRLARSQRQKLRQAGLSPAQVMFHQAYNQHMDRFPSESAKSWLVNKLFEFCANHDHWWKDAKLQVELRAKLKHLHQHGLLTEKDERQILDHLPVCDVTEEPGQSPAPSRKRKKGPTHPADDHVEQMADTRAVGRRKAEMRAGRGRSERAVDDDSTQGDRTAPLRRTPRKTPALASSSNREGLSTTPSADPIRNDASQPQAGPGATRRDVDQDVEMGDDRPIDIPPDTIKDVCICGIRIDDDLIGQDTTTCGNLKCPRGRFHMACVGVTKLDINWCCSECVS